MTDTWRQEPAGSDPAAGAGRIRDGNGRQRQQQQEEDTEDAFSLSALSSVWRPGPSRPKMSRPSFLEGICRPRRFGSLLGGYQAGSQRK